MRTTLDLPDELMRHLKARAALEGRSLRELVLEGTSPTYRQLVVLLEGAKTLTEQIIDCYQALDRLTGLGRADRAAFMATLIISAKLNDIDPQAWLADVLARIADIPQNRLHELLPWNWGAPEDQREAA